MSVKPFKKTPVKNVFGVNSIVTILSFELSPNYKTEAESHDFWEIVFVEEGLITAVADDKRILLREGEMIFHKPGELHSLECDKKRGASAFIITFDCHSAAMKIFQNKTYRINQELRYLIERLKRECMSTFYVSKFSLTLREDAHYGCVQLVHNYLEELLIFLVRSEIKLAEGDNTEGLNYSGYALAQQICDYLKERVYDSVRLDDVKEAFHFGKSHLCKVFKESVGVSIITYYMFLKVNEAKRLLQSTKLTSIEISQRLCFESPEYFSRVFRKYTGSSPRAYRLKPKNKA